MASVGRRITVVWCFPGTSVGTAPAAGIVDDARAAESAPSSPKTRTAPKRVIFLAKSLKKPSIDDRKAAKSAKRGARRPHSRTNYRCVGLDFFACGLNTCVRRRTGNAARTSMGAIRGIRKRARAAIRSAATGFCCVAGKNRRSRASYFYYNHGSSGISKRVHT